MTTIVCIAAGPSLTREQCEAVRGHRVIVVNRSWELAPWADHLYIADIKACRLWAPAARAGGFTGAIWCPWKSTPRGVLFQRARDGYGLCTDPGWIHRGRTSGYQALGLAYHLGATRIILLGYDYQHTDGKSHWHGDHPPGWANMRSAEQRAFPYGRLWVDFQREGIEVVNCSHPTALHWFPQARLEDVL